MLLQNKVTGWATWREMLGYDIGTEDYVAQRR